MMEARIKCLCAGYHIPSLGLNLGLGDVVYVPEEQARRSTELLEAAKVHAVEVRWGSRCVVDKAPVPPWLNRKVRPRRVAAQVEPVVVQPEPITRASEVEKRDTAAARLEMGEMLREIVRDELRVALKSTGATHAPQTVDPMALAEAVRHALSGLGTQTAPTLPSIGSDVPVFIPSGIVPTETKGTIAVSAETTSGDSVANASEALKATRGAKKKKE